MDGKTGFSPEQIRNYGDRLYKSTCIRWSSTPAAQHLREAFIGYMQSENQHQPLNAKAQRTANKGRKGKASRKEGRTIFRDGFSLRPCCSLCAFALNF